MITSEKIPALYELKAIEPTSASAASDMFTYDNLDVALQQQKSFENARYDEFYATTPDSITEEAKARSLARLYMVMTAQRIIRAPTNETAQLWSDRYTQATIELYGQPDTEIVRQEGGWRAADLLTRARAAGVDTALIDQFDGMTSAFGLQRNTENHEQKDFSEAASKLDDYLTTRYADVYDALKFDQTEGKVTAEAFADATKRGFAALAENHDEDWKNWTVEWDDGGRLTTYVKAQKLRIGKNRSPVTLKNAKGLFTHEILVHGLRGVNGKKYSAELQKGFVGYLDAEEGLAKFAEYAITGTTPASIDKYVDIALALGAVDGQKHSRKEMIEYVSTRMLIKNELQTDDIKKTDDEVMSAALKHVNRIYRGTLGNDSIGVFTKDIAYYDGFVKMGNYISSELQEGKPIEEIMEYITFGKFDPTNDRHKAEVERLQHEK